MSVPTPPTTVAAIGPITAAMLPARNSPSSLLAPMNTPFTALTRPRMSSGVSSCTSVCRTTTLTMSAPPLTASATSESVKSRENPKTTIDAP